MIDTNCKDTYFLLGERFLRFLTSSVFPSGELSGDLLRVLLVSVLLALVVEDDAKCPRELTCKCVPFFGGRPNRLVGGLERTFNLQQH